MRKTLGLTVIFLLASAGCEVDRRQATLAFNHLALSVKDVDRSADFYKRVLKLPELSRESRANGVRWLSLGQGQELHLISHDFYPGDTVTINKAVHLALTAERFDEALKLLDAGGVAYEDWAGMSKNVQTRGDGVKQVYFQDPDGYWIELNSAGGK